MSVAADYTTGTIGGRKRRNNKRGRLTLFTTRKYTPTSCPVNYFSVTTEERKNTGSETWAWKLWNTTRKLSRPRISINNFARVFATRKFPLIFHRPRRGPCSSKRVERIKLFLFREKKEKGKKRGRV